MKRSTTRLFLRHGLRHPSPLLASMILLSMAVGIACGDDPAPAPPVVDASSAREIGLGKLVGFTSEGGAHVWRGIPFAAPPVGDLRWRAPRPPQPWSATLEAIEFGSPCIQFAGPAGSQEGLEEWDTRGSEDCLYLNVFAPAFPPDAVPTGGDRLPVMLWIHGGGNTIGDAHIYDASRLATDQSVIVVSVHYRLGVLGWFSHEALAGPDATPDDRSGNYGTLDVIAGLRWVQEHISAFGGDPNRVTVFGESAGGTDTFAILASPRAAGLFHRAISQSGSGDSVSLDEARNPIDATPPGHPRSSSEVLFALLVEEGAAPNREAAKARVVEMTSAEISETLRAKSPTELLAVFVGGDAFGGMYRTPELVRDGTVLPKVDIHEAFARGHYNAVPAIFGSNRDEVKLFQAFGSTHVARMGMLPLWFKNERMYDLSAEYGAKFWKARGVDEASAAIASAGKAPVYAYRFDWDEEGSLLWVDLSRLFGAAHALELPFVFGSLSLGPATEYLFPEESRPGARILADQMMSYWGEFARTGNPGRGGTGDLPEWKEWGSNAGRFLVFDSENDGGLRLSDEILTRDRVLEQVEKDERFEDPIERCEIYGEQVVFGNRLTQSDYETIEDGLCKNVEIASQ